MFHIILGRYNGGDRFTLELDGNTEREANILFDILKTSNLLKDLYMVEANVKRCIHTEYKPDAMDVAEAYVNTPTHTPINHPKK